MAALNDVLDSLTVPAATNPEISQPCEFLPWDSDFFNLRIARARPGRLDPQAATEVETWCQVQQIDCVYLLVEAGDGPTIRLAERRGFQQVDIRLTLSRRLDELVQLKPRKEINVRPCRAEDVSALRAIAGASHSDTRFYFDPNFDRAACERLYQTWIEKSCHGYASQVLVACLGDQVAGYFSCDRLDAERGQIGLVGVAAAARGQQVGSALLEAGLGWFWEQGLRQVSVVTQGRNVPAQRLYQRQGFLTERVELWYHRWFHRPAPRQRQIDNLPHSL